MPLTGSQHRLQTIKVLLVCRNANPLQAFADFSRFKQHMEAKAGLVLPVVCSPEIVPGIMRNAGQDQKSENSTFEWFREWVSVITCKAIWKNFPGASTTGFATCLTG
jgi:hypothetical protein